MIGYRINLHESIAFLYTTTKRTGKEITETLPFMTASKKIKYLGINLIKEVKKLCNKSFKPLKKELRTLKMGIHSMFMD